MRLIDADEARKNMLKLLDRHLMMCNYSADSATQDCIEVINEATVVDAEPARHGYWVAKKVMARTPFAINHYCSKCKFETDFCTNYCSNCGAKMDEVSDE